MSMLQKTEFDKKIDELFGITLEELDLSAITNLPLICSTEVLPILARSFHVNIDDLEESESREQIHNALELHYKEGELPHILRKAIKHIFGDMDIEEWLDYKGKICHLIVESTNTNKIISLDFYNTLEKNIMDYRKVQSMLEMINIILETKIHERYASVFLTGETIEVFPFYEYISNLDSKLDEKYASASILSECITSGFSIKDYIFWSLLNENYASATKLNECIKSNLTIGDLQI